MRIDKYLKVSRLIKRRSIAAESCENGRVLINGKAAKPSTAVNVGDRITLLFGERELNVEVTSIAEHATKSDASELYKALS